MSCLTDDKNTLGFIRVETHKVIIACNNVLNSIYSHRSDARRQYCQQWLAAATKKWRFLRFFGFRKPVLKDALREFYHGSHFSPSVEVRLTYRLQEVNCKDLLLAAKATHNATMWISNEGARACNL